MRFALALAVCLAAPLARAEPPPDAGAAPMQLNPDGGYEGVAPGATHLPPRAPRLPLRRGPQRLTWTGFQVRNGVPTIFLELTGAPDYRVDERPGALVITLKNTIVPLRNNRRPLRVAAFGTPVTDVETRVHGRTTTITIHTKDAGPPHHRERVEPAAGGFQLLLVELAQ